MSYHEAVITCDCCTKDIEDGATTTCGKCVYELEAHISDLKKEIARLKKENHAHGGEAEVGGEEREKLAEHFDHVLATHNDPTKPPCPLCQQIRALLRQPRTVSREWVRELAAIVWNENMGVIEHAIRKKISELGYEVKEKAMSQFTEVAVAEEEK